MVDRAQIQALAPDSASLSAAVGLVAPRKWVSTSQAAARSLWFGECQGSGSAPYRVVVAVDDLGYKCTCPSRKFPCKHVLALLIIGTDAPARLVEGTVPDWAEDWIGRRRKKEAPTPAPAGAASPGRGASFAEAEEAAAATAGPSEASLARSAKLRASREAAMDEGVVALESWVTDQLERGLATFVRDPRAPARTAAARLVDAKAPGLAGAIDQLAADLLAAPESARVPLAIEALARILTLARAFLRRDALTAPARAEVGRLVGIPARREEVLADPDAVRARGSWTVVGARSVIQVDQLRRNETWLLRDGDGDGDAPRFAVLIDYHPLSLGVVRSGFVPGERLEAEVAWFPAPAPRRAVIVERAPTAPDGRAPASTATLDDVAAARRAELAVAPWAGPTPFVLGPCQILRDADGALFLADPVAAVPLVGRTGARALGGLALCDAVGLWDSSGARLLSADSAIGRWFEEDG